MRTSHRNNSHQETGNRGFALLITLTLLAFVVLLLVGLATYTRVETAIAGNSQRQAQARENALLALNVALDQLQKHAGPDQRVTAAGAAGPAETGRNLVSVWNAAESGVTPLALLVSGSELPNADPAVLAAEALNPSTAAAADEIFLLGNYTLAGNPLNPTPAELAERVKVKMIPLTAPGVPGLSGSATIGRYAWWVGDQGIKAPVAVAASADRVDYAPYADATGTEVRSRIAQQIALGAGATSASGDPVIEPRDANNAPVIQAGRVLATNQLAFLRMGDSAGTPLGLTALRQNFHAWSPDNFAVIADTRRGGLRQDLSLLPNRLGGAYSAWARYERPRAVNMEPPTAEAAAAAPGVPRPIPEFSATDPLRRRYFITPSDSSGGIEAGVHPVLTFFGISFSIRLNSAKVPEVSSECVVGLWNPYTSALVPPTPDDQRLRLEISGLPQVIVSDSAAGPNPPLDLQQAVSGGGPLGFTLEWPNEPTREDEASWLPGRVHYWLADAATSQGGNVMLFNERNTQSRTGFVRPLSGIVLTAGTPQSPVYRQCAVQEDIALRIQLFRGSTLLATFESPRFSSFSTAPAALETDHSSNDFAFIFRLPDPAEIPDGETQTWLSAANRDPRLRVLPGSAFIAVNVDDPAANGGPGISHMDVANPSRLLDRATNAYSYNEDVPVFELPRAPILSVGALQHLALPAARPFAIGNPWGSGVQVSGMPANELFDRFFYSGISAEVVATETLLPLMLPNPLLKPLRKPDGSHVTLDDIRATATALELPPPEPPTEEPGVEPPPEPDLVVPITGRSSKYFLQGAAFNVNSTNPVAWAAVLRSVRFTATQSFTYLDASAETGTAGDDARATAPQSGEAQFFRFPQSAQETFKAEPAAGASPEEGITPPNTLLYRQGMRTLTATQLTALAEKIAENVRTKLASTDAALGGPFRSLEEFLSPSSLFAGLDSEGNALAPRSVLEAAIADAGINAEIGEFSSQWLTQGDIMSALAPVLFPRSDTFVIRAHGQAINPVKVPANGAIPPDAVEGRAWCEAVVQRLPEYFDAAGDDAAVLPADLQSEFNKRYGRRFKIVSFRWLTSRDI